MGSTAAAVAVEATIDDDAKPTELWASGRFVAASSTELSHTRTLFSMIAVLLSRCDATYHLSRIHCPSKRGTSQRVRWEIGKRDCSKDTWLK